METEVVKLIGLAKELAPEMWAILLKQVQLRAWSGLILAVFMLLLALVSSVKLLAKWFKTTDKKHEYGGTSTRSDNYSHWISEYGGGWWIAGVSFGLVVGVTFLLCAFYDFSNPAYAALKLLKNLL